MLINGIYNYMRKNFIYLIIIPFLLLCYILSCPNNNSKKLESINSKEVYSDKEQTILINYNSKDFKINLRSYLIGVLACEMPALFNEETLKAGAVAARTYYYNKLNSVNNYIAKNTDQCYIDETKMKEKWNENFDLYYTFIVNAVTSTDDEVIFYDDSLINAYYFSLSNGKTEECSKVFGNSYPYLISTDSSWDKNVQNYEYVVTLTVDEFKTKLNIKEKNLEINVLSKTESGRINELLINNKIYSGIEIRKLFNLRSTDFDLNVDDDKVIITTRGYGHGVGMSQYGANELGKMGYSYIDILKYYYNGVEIKKYNV